MPYIKTEEREHLAKYEFPWVGQQITTPGQLNYAITTLCLGYFSTGEKSYQDIATITGVLENVKQEMYRRVATPYEDSKILINGDVY